MFSVIVEGLRSAVRPIVPKTAYRAVSALTDWISAVRVLGLSETMKLYHPHTSLIELHPSNLAAPFFIRPDSSDPVEFLGTICRESYGQILPDVDPEYIVDAGANIGDSAAWLLSRYPKSQLLAIEPDVDNCELLRKNLFPYGERVHIEQVAVWPVATMLNFGPNPQKDAREVVESGSGDIPGVPLPDLLKKHNFPHVDLFKCDIESAEEELFSLHADEWLSLTRFIVIEIHNPPCRTAVLRACQGFSQRQFRGLTIFSR